MLRIGQGFDVHSLVPERDLILGGELIPFDKGLEGHSDADVLVHAIMDALLGALSLGDIGKWFPDNNSEFKNADSIELLKKIIIDTKVSGWNLENLDCTIIAQEPKLAEFIPAMRNKIASVFNTPVNNISIKATTTEKLGFCGRGEGIAAMAVILMCSTNSPI
jgi:2-C-methyl-D-erythritol 2,4-cyclodiphosphate synthase